VHWGQPLHISAGGRSKRRAPNGRTQTGCRRIQGGFSREKRAGGKKARGVGRNRLRKGAKCLGLSYEKPTVGREPGVAEGGGFFTTVTQNRHWWGRLGETKVDGQEKLSHDKCSRKLKNGAAWD